MYLSLSEKLRKIARSICADNPDTAQYVYTNPGNDYPSDISYDVWPGEPSNKQNDPDSKKDDLKKKYDLHHLNEEYNENDVLDDGQRPSFRMDPEAPKTDAQDRVQDNVKSKGDDADELDRETWVGEGIIDPFNF